MLRFILIFVCVFAIAAGADSQTVISFTVEQPELPFSVDAGVDQFYDGENPVILGGEPSASGGFEEYLFQWDNAEFLDDPTSANPEVTSLNAATTFTLSVTDVIGNCIKEDEVFVDYVVSAINLDQAELKAFPNPFRDQLTIKSSESVSSIRVFDITGRMVQSETIQKDGECVLSTAHYPSGIYLFEFRFDNGLTKIFKLCRKP
jgi:hypothetical protein